MNSTPSNSSQTANLNHIKGWILDAYPAGEGEITVWVITEKGERVKLTDKIQSKIYVSAKQDELERLISRLYSNPLIASWRFVEKYAQPTDTQKTNVLELTLKDIRKTRALTRSILRMGDYLRYQLHNCDLKADHAYFFSHHLFPLAHIEVKTEKAGLAYTLHDSASSTDYTVPEMRVAKLHVETAKQGKLASFKDPIDQITLSQGKNKQVIDNGSEADKLLDLAENVNKLDPDFILTQGGDSYLFPTSSSAQHCTES
jgi:DNA polymerase elongation subunit (family B)